MKMNALLAAGLVLTLPAVAQAGEWGGMATVGFSKSSLSGAGVDVKSTTLDFNGYYDFQNGFTVGFDAGVSATNAAGIALDLGYLALDGKYKFQNNMTAGGYVERGSIDVDLLGADAAVTSYGLTFGYETDRLDAEVFLGKSNTSPSLPAGVDVKDYGVRVGYQISPKAFVVGSLARTDISGVGGGVDLDMISLGGGYAFNDEFSVFGGVQRISLDIASADATTYGLGVAYQPARMNTVPMIFSLELARTSLDIGGPSADLNTVRLGVSIPLGNTSKGVPVNSLVNNIAKGGRSVVTSGIMGVF